MREVETLDGLGRVVIQDGAGRLAQHFTETLVDMSDRGREWTHTIAEGWWDLNMTVSIDPSWIQLPARIVWEER